MILPNIKKKITRIRIIVPAVVILLLGLQFSCSHPGKDTAFTFVFMTDIHLQPEENALAGLTKAIETVNRLNPDFVITGGDLVMDVMEQKFDRADMLYHLYVKTHEKFKMPVYNTLGNHELFGIYEKSGIDPSHPEYGKKMFSKRIGKTYYSFDYKGWHFMILDSIGITVGETGKKTYRGFIDNEQMEWIKGDLAKVKKDTPIVISTHIPFITSMTQIYGGSLDGNKENIVVNNSKEVLDMFKEHNLKLVLQGHLHMLEDIYVKGIHFITGGAVCGNWWEGVYKETEEGFLLIDVKKETDTFDWEYIDYGWEALKKLGSESLTHSSQ